MKKIRSIVISMLLITTSFLFCAIADDNKQPEIEDETGDARSYIDIEQVWFHEDQNHPDVLYITIQVRQPNALAPKQHLTVHWNMNEEHYSAALAIGYGFQNWFYFDIVEGYTYLGEEYNVSKITGDFNTQERTITFIIPKNTIGYPKKGDILTETHSVCFQRFGFWGRLGFSPKLREIFFVFFDLSSLQVFDFAPNITPEGTQQYGLGYIIKY